MPAPPTPMPVGGGGGSGAGALRNLAAGLAKSQALILERITDLEREVPRVRSDAALALANSSHKGGYIAEGAFLQYVAHPWATPAQLTANVNDYDVGFPISCARISSNAARSITGFLQPVDDGHLLILANIGAFNITVMNQDAGSAAANRVITGTGAGIAIAPDGHMILKYDVATTRWRVIA